MFDRVQSSQVIRNNFESIPNRNYKTMIRNLRQRRDTSAGPVLSPSFRCSISGKKESEGESHRKLRQPTSLRRISKSVVPAHYLKIRPQRMEAVYLFCSTTSILRRMQRERVKAQHGRRVGEGIGRTKQISEESVEKKKRNMFWVGIFFRSLRVFVSKQVQ